MTPSWLRVRRFPYEEPYALNLEFAGGNGLFSGCVEIYCNVEDLSELGRALLAFPRQADDRHVYEYGSDDAAERQHRHFRLSFYTIDHTGHCAVQFLTRLYEKEPDDGACQFSIRTEPAALHRLGQLFENFARLEHLELRWSPAGGELFTDHTSDA